MSPETLSEPLLLSIRKAGLLLGIRETKTRELIRAGRLKSVRLDGSHMVERREVERFIDELAGR